MEPEVRNRDVSPPKLLDLISEESGWVGRDSGGRVENGFGVQEETKLELRLGLPVDEDWGKTESKTEVPSLLSLGCVPKASKTSKRGFLDTPKSENEGSEMKSSSPSAVNTSQAITNNSEAKTSSAPVVGWPPVRSFRKSLASSSSKPPPAESHNGGSTIEKKTEIFKERLFVKINMDGIPIGRKVDVKACGSYDKLTLAVEELFSGFLAAQKDPSTSQDNGEEKQRFTGLLDGSGEYTVVYEDNEGDRMLVGDVPWEMFVSTVKRLKVLKTSELSTLALGASSRKRTATES